MFLDIQAGTGFSAKDRRWWTRWRATSKWIFVCSACSTAPSRRSATRTTTVLLTRRNTRHTWFGSLSYWWVSC